ncbi:guanine nucleotide-binding protein subunit alpha [Lobulomyces angularis]|nr:guanine nucleotide-binding protein subunit alpha [Lobulomyces angularis]
MYIDDINVNVTELEDKYGINLTEILPSKPAQAIKRNKKVDKEIKQLNKDKKKNNYLKILILGSADSGKSTFIRQLRLIYVRPFTSEEISFFKNIIFLNIITAIKALLTGLEVLNLKPNPDLEFQKNSMLVKQYEQRDEKLIPIEIRNTLCPLWEDPDMQKCFKRRLELEFSIQDTIPYFLNEIRRICQDNYEPTNQDIVCTRRKTLAVTETEVASKRNKFRIYDVGGHRSIRNAWISFFDDVHSIIFIVAISSYDQKMEEDKHCNRMVDAINLFGSIAESPLLEKVPIMLFLNKMDIFEEKIKLISVKKYFKEYEGGNDLKSCKNFFKNLLLKKTKRLMKYVFFTTNTDSKLSRKLIASIDDILCGVAIKDAGLI